MRWYNDSGESLISAHALLLLLGFDALIVAAVMFQLGTNRSSWPTASAQILSVEVRCRMTPMGWRYRHSYRPVIIGCEQVDRFRADNTNRSWSSSRVYSGEVAVTRDGQTVRFVRPLSVADVGMVPAVGGVFEVVQNPRVPTDVSRPNWSLSELMIGGSLAGLGAFLLAIAFFWV
ncbi:hypothetical protein [Devosia sp. A369]